ncbi:hypothetical protein LJC68_03400 [Bacteroidales bacterium OttesenSCG-928-B11]|nr:hypothetical protein [Bacteroidales bacterium OttesenSCG-928-E04]MDL2311906.1 hypothetical protein [Bacteroidales bacterium OttesenSCG-928-B11]
MKNKEIKSVIATDNNKNIKMLQMIPATMEKYRPIGLVVVTNIMAQVKVATNKMENPHSQVFLGTDGKNRANLFDK